MILKRIMRRISLILIASIFHLCWLTSFGWAEIAATDSVVAVSMQISADREKIRALLNREDVQHQLEAYGISHEEALARVNSLTDEEVTEIAGKLDELQAAGESPDNTSWVGIIVSIIFFLPILVLDFFVCLIPSALNIPCFLKLTKAFLQENYPSDYKIDQGRRLGLDYCQKDCDSDFSSCVESANGKLSEVEECRDDKKACYTICSNWSYDFHN